MIVWKALQRDEKSESCQVNDPGGRGQQVPMDDAVVQSPGLCVVINEG